MASRDTGIFLKQSAGQMIKVKYLFLRNEIYMVSSNSNTVQICSAPVWNCLQASVCPWQGVTLGCSCSSEVGSIWLCWGVRCSRGGVGCTEKRNTLCWAGQARLERRKRKTVIWTVICLGWGKNRPDDNLTHWERLWWLCYLACFSPLGST